MISHDCTTAAVPKIPSGKQTRQYEQASTTAPEATGLHCANSGKRNYLECINLESCVFGLPPTKSKGVSTRPRTDQVGPGLDMVMFEKAVAAAMALRAVCNGITNTRKHTHTQNLSYVLLDQGLKTVPLDAVNVALHVA